MISEFKLWLVRKYLGEDTMETMFNSLKSLCNIGSGYGTYVLGFATIIHGLTGYMLGSNDMTDSVNEVWAGLSLVLLRRGISNAKR